MPDVSLLYNIKRVEEKIIVTFIFSPRQKLEYNIELLKDRFDELKYVINNKDYSLFLSSSLRYSSSVGDITNLVTAKNLVQNKQTILQVLTQQKKEIDTLLKNDDGTNDWKFIQDDSNYITIYSAKIKAMN